VEYKDQEDCYMTT